jgi:hypothetical protein
VAIIDRNIFYFSSCFFILKFNFKKSNNNKPLHQYLFTFEVVYFFRVLFKELQHVCFSRKQTGIETKKNSLPVNNHESFEKSISQFKLKPYPKPKGPLAEEVPLGGSLSDSKQGETEIQQKPNNTGLPDNLKTGIENLSGYSMNDVKVHFNSDKPAQLQAKAYAVNTDIHITAGQEKHLPHEAWHVVQQMQGRVNPTKQMKDEVNVNDDIGLEKEADSMGEKASNSADIITQKKRQEITNNGSQLSNVAQLKPADWNSLDVNLTHSCCTKWGLITAGITQYKALDRANAQQRKTVLDQMKLDIQQWEADANHADTVLGDNVPQIQAKIKNIKRQLSEEYAEMKMEALELAEHGHSIARHGPEVTDEKLLMRLFTGIAPDDKLSPAPGASSRFSSYEMQLETRQASATALQTTIAAVQASILNWKQQYLTPKPSGRTQLQDEAFTKTADRNAKLTDVAASKRALKDYEQVEALDKEAYDLRVDLSGYLNQETNEQVPPAEGEDRSRIDARLTAIGIEKAQLLQQLHLATVPNPGTYLSNDLKAKQDLVQPAQEAMELAISEKDHPGKSLKRVLQTAKSMKLDVNDDTVANAFAANIKLEDKYSVVVDHGKDIGSGYTGTEEVSLTDVHTAVKNKVPTKDDVKQALTGLGLAHNIDEMADFIIADPQGDGSYPNLKAIETKGEKGKVFKGSAAANHLQKTFTMFECGAKDLFGANDAAVQVLTANWKAIQHFPAKSDATDGVQEKL